MVVLAINYSAFGGLCVRAVLTCPNFLHTSAFSNISHHFVDINNVAHVVEDLRLMSSCRHHIIAKSTFSFWGAWLNSAPSKIVIEPQNS